MTLPNLLGIGAQRAGTNWLRTQLMACQAIYVPERRTEVGYFDEDYARGIDWYRGFFPPADQAAAFRWITDVSPRYLHDPSVPARIAESLSDPRFVVILRQPADRLYSHYGLVVRNRNERRPFDQWVAANEEIFRRGLYGQHLARYLSLFPRERFLVLIFEEAMADKAATLRAIAHFLDLPHAAFGDPDAAERRVNDSYRPRHARTYAVVHGLSRWARAHDLDAVMALGKRLGLGPQLFGRAGALPTIAAETRADLTRRYSDDIAALEALLGRSLDRWRAPR